MPRAPARTAADRGEALVKSVACRIVTKHPTITKFSRIGLHGLR